MDLNTMITLHVALVDTVDGVMHFFSFCAGLSEISFFDFLLGSLDFSK
jgi:hypothetical protein